MILRKFVLPFLLVFLVSLFGCATVCKDGPALKAQLDSRLGQVQLIIAALQPLIPFTQDVSITTAFTSAQAMSAAIEALMATACPTTIQANELINQADTTTIPQGNKAITRAIKLGLIKPKPSS